MNNSNLIEKFIVSNVIELNSRRNLRPDIDIKLYVNNLKKRLKEGFTIGSAVFIAFIVISKYIIPIVKAVSIELKKLEKKPNKKGIITSLRRLKFGHLFP